MDDMCLDIQQLHSHYALRSRQKGNNWYNKHESTIKRQHSSKIKLNRKRMFTTREVLKSWDVIIHPRAKASDCYTQAYGVNRLIGVIF
jgi:isochorismate synthase EntC